MIGRPYPLSTATACAFIATSSPPFAAPSIDDGEHEKAADWGPAPAEEGDREQERRRPDDPPATEPGDQRADDRHGDERAHRRPEQGDAEQTLAQAQLLLYGRYPDDQVPITTPLTKNIRAPRTGARVRATVRTRRSSFNPDEHVGTVREPPPRVAPV